MADEIGKRNARLWQLDALRGLIMVLMALDHANHFVAQTHSPGEYWGGPLPSYPTAGAFLTRLATQLCAPGFFFLMGIGIILFAESRRKLGWSEMAVTGHFLVRGALLIVLQLLVVNRAWELSPGGWVPQIYVGVLFALGSAMMLAGAALRRLPPGYLVGLTVALFLATELYTPPPGQWGGSVPVLQQVLLIPGGDAAVWVNYPVLPWLPYATLGLLFGRWLVVDVRKAFERALWLGGALLAAFVVVRALDGFGNIQPRPGDSWVDFLNVVKYPPSVSFGLLTMGISLTLLGALGPLRRDTPWGLQPLAVFGRVPLLFYLAHLFVYAAIGNRLTPSGVGLLAMYGYWVVGLIVLYPVCAWYGGVKHSQRAHRLLRFV